MSDTIDLRPQGAIPVTSLLAPGTPGVEYRLTQYPGSSLSWDAAQSKYLGTLGGGFADFATLDAVSKTGLAYGVTACLLSGVWYVLGASGWVEPSKAIGTETLWGPNLFVLGDQVAPNIVDNKYVADNGTFPNSALYYVSSKITVTPGDVLTGYATTSALTNNQGCFYNASDIVISSLWSQLLSSGDYTVTVPVGAAYMRLTVEKSFISGGGFPCWRKIINAKTPITKITIEGDSIALGALLTSKNFASFVGEQFPGSTITNIADPGRIWSDVYNNRVNIPIDSDYIIVFCGTNDFGLYPCEIGTIADTSATTMYGAIYAWVAYVRRRCPQAKIVLCTPMRRKNGSVANANGYTLRDYATAIKDACAFHGIICADVHDKAGVDGDLYEHQRLYFGDLALHPKAPGHKLISDVIMQAIR